MINLEDYPKQKDAGSMALAKIGEAFAISARRFDPTTGQELAPEVAALALEDIEKFIKNYQNKIDALTLLKADLEGLK